MKGFDLFGRVSQFLIRVNDFDKESLGQFLWEARFRQVKKRMAKKAKAAGVITEEDVFSRIS
jgi:hypothetical protein